MLLIESKTLVDFDTTKYDIAVVFTLINSQWSEIIPKVFIHYTTVDMRRVFRDIIERQAAISKFKKESPVLIIFDIDSLGKFYNVGDLIASLPSSVNTIIASPKDFLTPTGYVKLGCRESWNISKEYHIDISDYNSAK
jgi:hypothetical protein